MYFIFILCLKIFSRIKNRKFDLSIIKKYMRGKQIKFQDKQKMKNTRFLSSLLSSKATKFHSFRITSLFAQFTMFSHSHIPMKLQQRNFYSNAPYNQNNHYFERKRLRKKNIKNFRNVEKYLIEKIGSSCNNLFL